MSGRKQKSDDVKKSKTGDIKAFLKENTDGSSKTEIKDLSEIKSKLDDPEYMNFAIYRLAAIITEKILSLRS